VTAPARPRLRSLGHLAMRSLGNKLALLFSAIIAIAFAGVLGYVVPDLRSNLEEQAQLALARVARVTSDPLARAMGSEITEDQLNELVRAVSERSDANVMLLGVQRSVGVPGQPVRPPTLYLISDSRVEPRAPRGYGLAQLAVARGDTQSTVRHEAEGPVARVATPLFFRGRADWVVVYSRDLSEVGEIVGLIQRRVLVAAAVALFVASCGGYLLAQALARRVRRVESAARHVAAGHFVEPLPIDSPDEIGDLGRAFNDMQEQLVRLDRARREFIANASHELRTPIFSLGGFAELLQDEDLDPETRDEFLGQMREQTERLKKLAGDLLDLSRLDAGVLQLSSEPVDLPQLLRKVAAEFTPTLTRHESELELHLEEDVAALADRERLAQIVRILLDNALRHTPQGAPARVEARSDGERARVSVVDRGPELSGREVEQAIVRQAFDRFYTGDASGGSGLGLAIARELAQHMGGSIAIEATASETKLTVELPAAPGGAPAPPRAPAGVGAAGERSPAEGGGAPGDPPADGDGGASRETATRAG
jgi:two-component system OmpR family sensor kinase